jgi:hypothetical protein
LATITTASENSIVNSLLFGDQYAFIGASDNESSGAWKWIAGPESGTIVGSLGYTNWWSGEPSNTRFGTTGPSSENALFVSPSSKWQGKWWDGPDFYRTDMISADIVVEYGGLPESYSISPSTSSVNEGNSVTFTINTKNVEWGSTISYSISGISQADLSSGSLTGSAVVNQNGLDGQATVTLGITADQLTEGNENLTINVSGATSTVVINDTSKSLVNSPVFKTTPTGINYSVSTLSLSGVIQGATSVVPTFFHYLPGNTKETLPIQAAGIYSFEVIRDSRWNNDGSYLTVIGSITYLDGTKKDLVGRLNTYMGGVIFSDGSFDYSVNDFVTNSFDSFLNIGQFAPGNNSDVGKKFTFSITPVSPSYIIKASSPSVNEGSSVSFQITTNSVEWGSTINYSISGISQSDLSSGSLLGSTTVAQNGTSGTATISLGIAADQLTEGPETLVFNVGNTSASTIINDTSKSKPVLKR